MLPKFQFSIHLITWAPLTSDFKGLRWPDCTLSQPLWKEADRQVTQSIAITFQNYSWKQPTVLSRGDLAIPAWILTVFTHLACYDIRYINRCDLSITYHFKPLAENFSHQYDLKPTRRYHSVMFIHELVSHGGLLFLLLHYSVCFTWPRALASPLPPVADTLIGCSIPFGVSNANRSNEV